MNPSSSFNWCCGCVFGFHVVPWMEIKGSPRCTYKVSFFHSSNISSLIPPALIALSPQIQAKAKKHSLPNMVHLTLPAFIALLATTTSLVSSSSDDSPMEYPNGLMKRQSGAFIPSTTHGNGKTCADAFGPGFVTCGKGIQCVNPAQGQTCCSEGCKSIHFTPIPS